MNRLLYITGILSVLAVAVGFTVTTFTEPIAATGEKQENFNRTYTVKEFFAVSDGDSVGVEGETAVLGGVDTSEEDNASETILEPSTAKRYYNAPLDEELQDCIFAECEKYGIPPAIVIAIIERESNFDTYAMGDDGRSFGLMQVQPKWHLQKMVDMGCTDLFNAYQNIKVGISILGELKLQRNDVGWALTAYNSGASKADNGISNYAKEILSRANEIESMRCNNG